MRHLKRLIHCNRTRFDPLNSVHLVKTLQLPCWSNGHLQLRFYHLVLRLPFLLLFTLISYAKIVVFIDGELTKIHYLHRFQVHHHYQKVINPIRWLYLAFKINTLFARLIWLKNMILSPIPIQIIYFLHDSSLFFDKYSNRFHD